MSVIIMATTRPIRERPRGYIDSATEANFTIDGALVGAEKEQKCKEIRSLLESFIAKIESAINELDTKNIEWMQWLGGLERAAQANETAIFEGFAEGPAGHISLMEKGRESIIQLKKKQKFWTEFVVKTKFDSTRPKRICTI